MHHVHKIRYLRFFSDRKEYTRDPLCLFLCLNHVLVGFKSLMLLMLFVKCIYVSTLIKVYFTFNLKEYKTTILIVFF